MFTLQVLMKNQHGKVKKLKAITENVRTCSSWVLLSWYTKILPKIGITNAKVFPDPVLADPSISSPLRASPKKTYIK